MCIHVSLNLHVHAHVSVQVCMHVCPHACLSLPSPHTSQSRLHLNRHRNFCLSKLRCRGSWNHVTADFLFCVVGSQEGVKVVMERECRLLFNLCQAVGAEEETPV